MPDQKDIEYRLELKDLASATFKRIEESMARVDKLMIETGQRSAKSMRDSADATNRNAAATGRLRDSLRGLSPSIGVATASLSAMGVEGTGAFGAITRGLSALAINGLNPVGVAIGATAALLGTFAGKSTDAAKKSADAWSRFNEIVEKTVAMRRQLAEMRGGPSADEEAARAALRKQEEIAASARRPFESLSGKSRSQMTDVVADLGEVTAKLDELRKAGFDESNTAFHALRARRDMLAPLVAAAAHEEDTAAFLRSQLATIVAMNAERKKAETFSFDTADFAATKDLVLRMSRSDRKLAGEDSPATDALEAERSKIDELKFAMREYVTLYGAKEAAQKDSFQKLGIELEYHHGILGVLQREYEFDVQREQIARSLSRINLAAAARSIKVDDANVDTPEWDRRRAVLVEESRFEIENAEATGKRRADIVNDMWVKILRFDQSYAAARRAMDRDITRNMEDAQASLANAKSRAGLDPRDTSGAIRQSTQQALDAENLRFKRENETRSMKLTESEVEKLTIAHYARLATIQTDGDKQLSNLSEATNRGILRSTEDFLRSIDDLHRTSYEKDIADEEVRYKRQLDDLVGQHEAIELAEKEHQARMRALEAQRDTPRGRRREAQDAEEAVLNDDSSGALDGFAARMNTIHAELKSTAQMGADTAQSVSDRWTQAFVDFGTGAKSARQAYGEMAKGILQDLQVMLLKQAAMSMLTSAVGGISGGLGSIFGGGAAAGGGSAGGGAIAAGMSVNQALGADPGPTSALWISPLVAKHAAGGVFDRPHLGMIGEAGPEAVIPLSGGRRVPVEMRGARHGGESVTHQTTNHVTVNINAADPASFRALLARDPDAVVGPITDAMNRNSGFREQLRRTARS